MNDYALITDLHENLDGLVCTAETGALFSEIIRMAHIALRLENVQNKKYQYILVRDIFGIDLTIKAGDTINFSIKLWKEIRNTFYNPLSDSAI